MKKKKRIKHEKTNTVDWNKQPKENRPEKKEKVKDDLCAIRFSVNIFNPKSSFLNFNSSSYLGKTGDYSIPVMQKNKKWDKTFTRRSGL